MCNKGSRRKSYKKKSIYLIIKANWTNISNSNSIKDFDNWTRLLVEPVQEFFKNVLKVLMKILNPILHILPSFHILITLITNRSTKHDTYILKIKIRSDLLFGLSQIGREREMVLLPFYF